MDKTRKESFVLLSKTANTIQNAIEEALLPLGITAQQFNMLRILRGAQPETLCAKEVRERLIDKHADVSRLTNRMIDKGWIALKVSKKDRRQKDIHITESGWDMLNQGDSIAPYFPYQMIDHLNDEEVQQLHGLMKKILSEGPLSSN